MQGGKKKKKHFSQRKKALLFVYLMSSDPDTVSNVDLSEDQDDDMEDYEFSAVQAFGMAGMWQADSDCVKKIQ